MSTLGIVDEMQIDGYAPDVRIVEDVTIGDLQSRSITIGDSTIAPWMSVPGGRYWRARHLLFRVRHPQLYI